MTYGVPAEVDDMSVFALDKDKFPGCGDNSKAYENPEIICTPSSSDVSSGAGSDSGSGAGSSGAGSHSGSAIVSSESLSSASVVDVAVAALIFSLVSALLIQMWFVTLLSVVIQLGALIWYILSFIPGAHAFIASRVTDQLPL